MGPFDHPDQPKRLLRIALVGLTSVFFGGSPAWATYCPGSSTFTWTAAGGSTAWEKTGTTNWSPAASGYPGSTGANSGANTVVQSESDAPAYPGGNLTLGCFEITSGTMTYPNSTGTMTVDGDFINPNVGSITGTGTKFTVAMAGTAAQVFENNDTIPNITITNNVSVDFTESTTVSTAFTISSTGGEIYIDGTVSLPAFTIPAGVTVEIRSGGILIANGSITVNGTLRIDGGGKLNPSTGTITVDSGGSLLVEGSAGNVATIDAPGGDSYGISIASGGSLSADYFYISRCRTTTPGLEVSGTILTLSNGEFHYPVGEAITLESGATSTATWNTVGFIDDSGNGSEAVVATNYDSGGGATVNVTNWSGTNTKTDPSGKIVFGTQAAYGVEVSDSSNAPPTTPIAVSTTENFGAFGFGLNSNGGSTSITSITVTLEGNNTASDVSGVTLYWNTNGNCTGGTGTPSWNGTFAGSPPQAVIPITAGTITLTSTTKSCLQVNLTTSATATNGDTIGAEIEATTDVTDSAGYGFAANAGPPLYLELATITGVAADSWNGSQTAPTGAWNTAKNWSTNAAPTTTTNCDVGSGHSYPQFTTYLTPSCQDAHFESGGQVDFNSKAVTLTVDGALTVDASYPLSNAGSSTLALDGTSNQAVNFNGGTWGGAVTVTNAAGVTINSNMTISGNLTINSGTVTVASGVTLTVAGGSLTIGGSTTTAGLTLQPGAALELSDASGSTVTVSKNGTLTLVGNSSSGVTVTTDSTAHPFAIVASGNPSTISAQYYTLQNLGVVGSNTGLTIGANTTINSTNFLQNGSYLYPASNSTTFLTLNKDIPGNSLTGMTFDADGSSATGTYAVVATNSAASGTLVISNYTGSDAGPSFSQNGSSYSITWSSPTNTLNLTQQVSTTPSTLGRGTTVTMGEWGFQEAETGSTATNLTSLTVTMTGTDSSADVTAARLYQDTSCNGTIGTELGSQQTLSGTTPTATFSSLSYQVGASLTSPPMVCVILQFDISSSAASGTIGAEIASGGVSDSAGYAISAGSTLPVALGSPGTVSGTITTWTGGALTTNWSTGSNWSAGVPSSSIDCTIASATHQPTIPNGTTAACKNLTINSGATLTMAATSSLDVYGNFTNDGTFTQASQTVEFEDGGSDSTQTIGGSAATTFSSLVFSKTGGGEIAVTNPAVTATTFTFSGTFELDVQGGAELILPNGITVPSGNTMQLEQDSVVAIGNGKAITVSGGTFNVDGASSVYPNQTLANSGEVTSQNGGTNTWSFSATSGTVSLLGFVFDRLATTGAVISGTAKLSNFSYGQFTHLASGAIKTIVINTTGTIPASASDIGWEWDSSSPGVNSTYGQSASPPAIPNPAGSAYLLADSTGCGSQTMTFTDWFGDWYEGISEPNPNSEVSTSGCTLTFNTAQSPVSLISFTATPYNGTVVLGWTTGLETLNQGFNVYRSLTPDGGFAQINSSLIRNTVSPSTPHGVYQFYDNGVTNGMTYFYEIQDVANDGTLTMHGPVSAAPSTNYSAAPPPLAGAIQGSSSDSPAPGPSPTASFAPGIEQIVPGVTLLAKTDNSMRISISVPQFTTSPAQVSPYVNLSIPGYSSTTTAGDPALPQEIVMLEIPGAANASFSIVNQSSSPQSGILVASAPQWKTQSGMLVPIWTLDSTFYSTDQTLPSSPISLGPVVLNQGTYYLPLIIEPIAFDPVQQSVLATSSIVVDISLDGQAAWTPETPNPPAGPWGLEGALKITVSQAGVYQLAYSDFVDAGVDGAFAGRDLTRFKLYSTGNEIPLDVTSVNGGSFGPGDSFRFYAPYFATGASSSNTLMLIADSPSSNPGLRMQTLSGAPGGIAPDPEVGFIHQTHVEQNTTEWLNAPYMEGADHVFWGAISAGPEGGYSQQDLTTDFNLPELLQTGEVAITALLGGDYSWNSASPTHHLRLWANSDPSSAGDAYFSGTSGYIALFNIPATLFVPGANTITFQNVGDMNGNDYDTFGVNYFDVSYTHDWVADSDVADLSTGYAGTAISVSGFSANDILVYDVTDLTATAIVNGASISGSGPYGASFASVSGDPSHGAHFWIGRASNLPAPDSIELNPGSSLSSTSNGADVVYVGPADLLDAVRPLAALRAQEGYRTQLVDIEDVYSEFGQGLPSEYVLKSFLQFASTQWAPPALRYVVLVGDGTDDPTDSLGLGVDGTIPTHMMVGSAMDFASDNWFVAFDTSDELPDLAIGRIPGRTTAQISGYVSKVLAYESGAARPPTSGNIALVADIDQLGGENFAPTADALANSLVSLDSSIKPDVLLRSSMSDSQLHQAILGSFNSGTTIIHYLGHGAENMWADSDVFTNTDATALQNATYPVVVSMDCLNAAYFYADPAYQTLADTLVFNPSGGAIAFWGSASLTSSGDQVPYQTALYRIFASNPGGIRLGDAIRRAKVQAGWTPARAEVVRSFTLLGDPMLDVVLPAPPPPPPPPPSESNDGSSSGGFFSCLSLAALDRDDHGGPGRPRGTGGAAAESLLLLAMFIGGRRMYRRGPRPKNPVSG